MCDLPCPCKYAELARPRLQASGAQAHSRFVRLIAKRLPFTASALLSNQAALTFPNDICCIALLGTATILDPGFSGGLQICFEAVASLMVLGAIFFNALALGGVVFALECFC